MMYTPQSQLYSQRGSFADGNPYRSRGGEQAFTRSGNPYLPIFNSRNQMTPVQGQQYNPLQGMQTFGGPATVGNVTMPFNQMQGALDGMQPNSTMGQGSIVQAPVQQRSVMLPQFGPINNGQPQSPQVAAMPQSMWGWGRIKAMLAQQNNGPYV